MSSGPGQREVAYRLFAAEFDDAELSYSESDEERAPNYVVTPTGARVNRLFAVGVLTEVDDVNPEMVRGRVVDPTGTFVTYAGQYQPDALAFLERADPPAFLALSGKARTFEPEDDDAVYSSVRPESVSEVDGETRDRWIVAAAERTLDRVGVMAAAIEADTAGDQLRAALVEAGVDERLADGVALALEYYETTPAYLEAVRELALEAARVVAGELDEVARLDVAPDDAGVASASELATVDLSETPSPATADTGDGGAGDDGAVSDDGGESIEVTEGASATEPDTRPPSEPDVEEDDGSEPGDFDPGEFDLDDETRAEVEAEYGTEFSTADEVENAGIETSDPDPGDDETATTDDDVVDPVDTGDGVSDEASPDEDPEDVDLEDAVMNAMESVGDDDGADREELIVAVVDEHGVDPEAVEDAIQDALMSGRCYEPADGTLKAI